MASEALHPHGGRYVASCFLCAGAAPALAAARGQSSGSTSVPLTAPEPQSLLPLPARAVRAPGWGDGAASVGSSVATESTAATRSRARLAAAAPQAVSPRASGSSRARGGPASGGGVSAAIDTATAAATVALMNATASRLEVDESMRARAAEAAEQARLRDSQYHSMAADLAAARVRGELLSGCKRLQRSG